MNVLSIVAIILGSILGLFLLIRIIYSSSWYNALIFIILAAGILYAYWFLASFVYSYMKATVKFHTTNKNMEIWDNIWYTILILFIIMIISLFIKMSKSTNNKVWSSFMYVFGLGFILALYTVMYYLYMFYDEMPKITGILTGIVIGLTAIMYLFSYMNWNISIFYIIYGLAVLIWLIALFLFIFYLMSRCYNWMVV